MAIKCSDLVTGITRSDNCDGTFGGITGLYLGNKSEISAVKTRAIDGVITGITATGDVYGFEFEVEAGASFIQDKPDGQRGVTQTITATFEGMDTDKYNVFQKFIDRNYSYGIVRKPNGTYWLIGVDTNLGGFGLRGALNDTTGQAQTDIPLLTLTLTATTIKLAREITSAAALALINS